MKCPICNRECGELYQVHSNTGQPYTATNAFEGLNAYGPADVPKQTMCCDGHFFHFRFMDKTPPEERLVKMIRPGPANPLTNDDHGRKKGMSTEEQNRAIAEACGWKCLAGHDWIPPGKPFESRHTEELPEFTSDLNAMHEAEKVLTSARNSWEDYKRVLRRVTLRDAPEGSDLETRLISATSAQRAEAFLRALNLWKE